MAEFDREFLIGHGVPEDQVEEVLAAHEAAVSAEVSGMVPREEVQRQVDEAVAGMVSGEEARRLAEEAVAEALAGVDGEAVARLEAERDMLRAICGEAFEDVKPKFREQVYAMLDRDPGAKPVEEQLAQIRKEYEEYFIDGEAAQRPARFGGPVRGSMPRGSVGAAEQFRVAWGFGGRR